jgi:hypothetical protein
MEGNTYIVTEIDERLIGTQSLNTSTSRHLHDWNLAKSLESPADVRRADAFPWLTWYWDTKRWPDEMTLLLWQFVVFLVNGSGSYRAKRKYVQKHQQPPH